jgi:hypothetical protein
MTESFGLKPPAPDADTRAWLRPQGIRDLASGLVVLTNDADRGQAVGRHSSHRFCHHPSWRHVNRSGVGRLEVASVLNSWRNLRGDACRWSLVDPCHLREMPLTVPFDREDRIAISHCWSCRSIGLRRLHQRVPHRIGRRSVRIRPDNNSTPAVRRQVSTDIR